MSQVWVAGEALIDLVPRGNARVPIVGGGPANTAKALANLGLTTSFIGGISSDEYGHSIERELKEYGVDLRLANRSSLPTALAIVSLDENGSASYEFKLSETATFDFGSWLPEGSPSVLYVGTLATIIEPGASYLFEWARALRAPIVFDPNVRPSVLADKKIYREYFEKWAQISQIVKLSDADLTWLELKIDEILEFGPSVVVLTQGDKGISAYQKTEEIRVSAEFVKVVDTVGAGDTVGAVIAEALINELDLDNNTLRKVLQRAAKAAAITCSREGAKPPKLAELAD
jgi:fructokinase